MQLHTIATVRHYKTRDTSDVKISERLKKISIGSVRKKSSRISAFIRNATGFSQVDTGDEHFDSVESRQVLTTSRNSETRDLKSNY